MKIETPFTSDALKLHGEAISKTAERPAVTTIAAASRRDSVEFSAESRSLAGAQPLTDNQVHEIRERVHSGFYNTAASVDAVARSISKSGDL